MEPQSDVSVQASVGKVTGTRSSDSLLQSMGLPSPSFVRERSVELRIELNLQSFSSLMLVVLTVIAVEVDALIR